MGMTDAKLNEGTYNAAACITNVDKDMIDLA